MHYAVFFAMNMLLNLYIHTKMQIKLVRILTNLLGYVIIQLTIKLVNNSTEVFIMNREEILQKSRNEGFDEMEMQVRDKSMKWTYIVLVLSATVFAFIRSNDGLPTMDLYAVISLSAFANHLYQFIKIKKTSSLVIAVLMLLVSVFATIRFFMGH